MLRQCGPHRLTRGSALLAALLALLPMAISLRAAAEEKATQESETKSPPAVETSGERTWSQVIIEGDVKNEAGEPPADALSRMAMPAMDMRFGGHDEHSEGKNFLETRTDGAGHYMLAPAIAAAAAKVSIDA